jgi:REP element-mobilizing transposase RayT
VIESPKRKPNRLIGYDYSRNGAYFITICAKDREELFSSIVGAAPDTRLRLTEIGDIIELAITEIPAIYKGVIVDNHVIMPNHIHAIIINDGWRGHGWQTHGHGWQTRGRQVAAPTTMSRVVGHLKRIVSMRVGFSPWQKSFHDHIIRGETDYLRIAEYIDNNPARWREDCFYK